MTHVRTISEDGEATGSLMMCTLPGMDFLAAIGPFNFPRFNFTLSGGIGRPAVDCRPEIALHRNVAIMPLIMRGRRPRLAYSPKKSLLLVCANERHSMCQPIGLNCNLTRGSCELVPSIRETRRDKNPGERESRY
jgi:hypothetical protein